jgi:hypothetical protein
MRERAPEQGGFGEQTAARINEAFAFESLVSKLSNRLLKSSNKGIAGKEITATLASSGNVSAHEG